MLFSFVQAVVPSEAVTKFHAARTSQVDNTCKQTEKYKIAAVEKEGNWVVSVIMHVSAGFFLPFTFSD